jgi:hypothetical protein
MIRIVFGLLLKELLGLALLIKQRGGITPLLLGLQPQLNV